MRDVQSVSRNVYFVINLISDILNYVVFVIFNISIDAYMLVCFKITLKEKSKWFENAKEKVCTTRDSKKISEMTEAMNNAIRMVVLNSLFNFFFKSPLAIIPFINAIVSFYYKSKLFWNGFYSIDIFFVKSKTFEFYDMIEHLADWLFLILISCQLLFYYRFDKNIKMAFDKFRSKSTN